MFIHDLVLEEAWWLNHFKVVVVPGVCWSSVLTPSIPNPFEDVEFPPGMICSSHKKGRKCYFKPKCSPKKLGKWMKLAHSQMSWDNKHFFFLNPRPRRILAPSSWYRCCGGLVFQQAYCGLVHSFRTIAPEFKAIQGLYIYIYMFFVSHVHSNVIMYFWRVLIRRQHIARLDHESITFYYSSWFCVILNKVQSSVAVPEMEPYFLDQARLSKTVSDRLLCVQSSHEDSGACLGCWCAFEPVEVGGHHTNSKRF